MNYLPAKCFRVANRTAVDYVVIHTTDTPGVECRTGNAAKIALRFHHLDTSIDPVTGKPKNAPKSAHYVLDPTETWQCVDEADIAWHCPKANTRGIGIEHLGFSTMTADDWGTGNGLLTLENSARLTAAIAARWGIPIVHLEPGQIAVGRGFVGHVDVATEFPGSSDHHDPGTGWPWDRYLALVAEELDKSPAPQPPTEGSPSC